MLRNEIFEKVVKIVSSDLGVRYSDITEDKTFSELGADSLDFVEITISLEEEFLIDIFDDDSEKLETVGQVVDYIEKNLK